MIDVNVFFKNPPLLLAIDLETSGLTIDSEIITASISWVDPKLNETIRQYFADSNLGGKEDVFQLLSSNVNSQSFCLDPFDPTTEKANRNFRDVLDRSLFNPEFNGTIIFHNMNFDYKFLHRYFKDGAQFSSKNLCKMSDTLALSRIHRNNKHVAHINPENNYCHSLKYLAKEMLGQDHSSFETTTEGLNIRLIDRDLLLKYNELDTEITLRL
ncbi:MAG: hypothetical protein HON90_15050, partial [Halobacteriovoraceae bacterium]|nr:hypothetical protein [Halobacteriovoraceae bacterium]